MIRQSHTTLEPNHDGLGDQVIKIENFPKNTITKLPIVYSPLCVESKTTSPTFDNYETTFPEPVKEAVNSSPTHSFVSLKLRRENKKIKKLKEEIKEFDLLEIYIKNENESLKIQSAKLQRGNEHLEAEDKELLKQAQKWYKKNRQIEMQNRKLRIKVLMQQKKKKTYAASTSNMDILIDVVSQT
jgi:hypothetical protein